MIRARLVFPGTRRPPEDQRRNSTGLEQLTEHFTVTEQLFLAEKIAQSCWPHAFCKRNTVVEWRFVGHHAILESGE